MRFGLVPAVLHEDAIESVRKFERAQQASDIVELSGLKPGKSVVVTSGPLAGLEGLVTMVARERVIVLMHLLGNETRVTLGLTEVRAAA